MDEPVFPEISDGEYLLTDLDFIAEPDPTLIESFYRGTERDRTPWDFETLMIMVIARQSMQQKAKKADCEQPYTELLSVEGMEDKNESVVSSFFDKFRS